MFEFVRKLYEHFIHQTDAIDYSAEMVERIPSETLTKSNKIYLVGEKPFFKWALMKCPCGCNEVLTMSLMKKQRPYWVVKFDRLKRISLSPSVWKKDGCRSHFFVKKGKIIWANDLDYEETYHL